MAVLMIRVAELTGHIECVCLCRDSRQGCSDVNRDGSASAPLACDCVKGYAQRDYEALLHF